MKHVAAGMVFLMWAICGFISAGFHAAHQFEGGTAPPSYYQEIADDECAKRIGINLLGGISALVISPFQTGFFQYGWMLPCPSSTLGYSAQYQRRLAK